MAAEMMYGKPVVDAMIDRLNEEKIDAGLTVVQVGSLPESSSYVTQVEKTADKLPHLGFEHAHLQESTTFEELQLIIRDLNRNPKVSGYMFQLPLPSKLQVRLDEIRKWISPDKDVDLIGHAQRGVFLSGKREGQLLPPTPYAVMKMLKMYQIDVMGKIAVIIGDGHVGSLLKIMMGNDKATQIVCNEHTPDLAHLTRQGDIVVAATGIPNIMNGSMIKEGAVVVNVGMKFVNGTMMGDVDVDSVKEVASKVTPVSKGLGPVTVAALIQNTFRAAKKIHRVTPTS